MRTNELVNWFQTIETSRADEVKLDFAVALAKAIEDRGLSRKEFASLVGVAPARITKVLRGDTNLAIESMDRLATAVDLDLHIHLAKKGSTVRWFDVFSSPGKENTIQVENPSDQDFYCSPQIVEKPMTAKMDKEQIAL